MHPFDNVALEIKLLFRYYDGKIALFSQQRQKFSFTFYPSAEIMMAINWVGETIHVERFVKI